MEERRKTNKEIFKQKYPLADAIKSPIVCAEAIGYLKALIQYFPSEEEWASVTIAELTLTMLIRE